ncbi:hypothetical protein ACPF04_11550, partial [Campylobacter sp. MOP51]|uniref:hypothetical protein n=1 Tax=Campylobacter canis TaxID=3378588 RepID=UPI003C32FF47
LNVEYDLQVMKKAHEAALKKESRVYDGSKIEQIKQNIKTQEDLNELKEAVFNYEIFDEMASKAETKKGLSLLDLVIEKASGE